MRIQLTVPRELVSPTTLGAALEAATRLGTVELRNGRFPALRDAIAAGLRWRREPPGQESFDPPSVSWPRRWGDCDDLAPWRAAELRVTGEDRRARAIAIPSGPNTWHAIVQRSDGTREDPSAWAGMPTRAEHRSAIVTPARGVGRGAIVIGERSVRIDVPGRHALTRGCPMGYAVTAEGASRRAALAEALAGAVRIGRCTGIAEPRALSLLRALYRFVCQSQDIRDALEIEGLDPTLAPRLRGALLDEDDAEVGFACLAVVAAIGGAVAAAAGVVTPIIKAIVEAIDKTAKLVEQGVKPIQELYQQVKSGIDQGTLPLEHVLKTADELAKQGFGPEADKLRQEARAAATTKTNREFLSENDPDITNPVRVAELKMKGWRFKLAEATDVASSPPASTFMYQGEQIPAVDAANRIRDDVRRDVLAASYLPSPGPQAVWESLARAFGLDPATARPPVHVVSAAKMRAIRAAAPGVAPGAPPPRPTPAPAPQPGSFLPPGIDALFRRAGAFM